MPLVRISFTQKIDEAARAQLIERVTDAVDGVLAAPRATIGVLLDTVEAQDWGVGGVPLAVTFRARAAAAGGSLPRPQPRSVWTTTNGDLRLHALDFAGTAPAIVISPGITSPAATWRFVVDALDMPNRVIVLDNRGRGRSDAPAAGYAREDYAADILAWVKELALDRPVLLGHSMGARAAAAAAARLPGASLIAVDPPMSGPDRPYPTPLDFYLDGLAAVARGATLDDLRKASPGWSDERLKDRIDWLPTCSVSAITESHAHFHDEGFLDAWAAASGPALFIRGARSDVVRADDLDAVAAARPDARLATVADAGHMIPWDNLGGFVSTVKSWLEG